MCNEKAVQQTSNLSLNMPDQMKWVQSTRQLLGRSKLLQSHLLDLNISTNLNPWMMYWLVIHLAWFCSSTAIFAHLQVLMWYSIFMFRRLESYIAADCYECSCRCVCSVPSSVSLVSVSTQLVAS